MLQPKPFKAPVYITEPLLPPIGDTAAIFKKIWESKQVTNNGIMCRTLEKKLADFLKVKHLSLFSNGTAALQIACRALNLGGEVITTPFTFAATPHALAWNNIKPVFCDIENESMNIDPGKIEELVTKDTAALLPVHVFGTPCNVEAIDKIARRHRLKVIYDAAHAFGVSIEGKSIGSFGDASMFSLHATKVYNTIEGGALAFGKQDLKIRADILKNFGFRSESDVQEPGINGKLNELQSAIGILLLEKIGREIEARGKITNIYRNILKGIGGIKFNRDIPGVVHNYSYFVIRINKGEYGLTRDEVYEELKKYNVFSRRYFYPLCSNFKCYGSLQKRPLSVAQAVSEEVLALPLHGRMDTAFAERICSIISYIKGRAHKL